MQSPWAPLKGSRFGARENICAAKGRLGALLSSDAGIMSRLVTRPVESQRVLTLSKEVGGGGRIETLNVRSPMTQLGVRAFTVGPPRLTEWPPIGGPLSTATPSLLQRLSGTALLGSVFESGFFQRLRVTRRKSRDLNSTGPPPRGSEE